MRRVEMTRGKPTSFLYLSEPDLIDLGVLDVRRCVEVCQEVFSLLSEGDYLMGGSNHNSHGMGIVFPEETKFPNMPVAGPDRRFVAMPAYLGGRFDVCGVKWYGSNAANQRKGLPRSVLTLMLNDKDTGEPLCLMSANLISAMRTGGVPGVATKYLAREDADSCSVIGCGPINKSCFQHIISQAKNIKRVVCFDLFEEKSENLAKWIAEEYGLTASTVKSAQEAVERGDILTVAASRIKPLYIKYDWVKKGATILLSGPAKGDDALWINSKIIYDNIPLHEAYMEEAIASGNVSEYYSGVIGGPIYSLIDDGKLRPITESMSLGDIIRGQTYSRSSDDDVIIFVACGMAVFDVAYGYDMYREALKKNIGRSLDLWKEPYLK
jgi:ornithine cyclodeaminase